MMNYAIGHLARRAGYAVQTVRYYEQTGLMPKPPRSEGRQRRYGEDHLKRLLFIRHARDLGFEVADRLWRDNLGENGAAIRMRSGSRSAS